MVIGLLIVDPADGGDELCSVAPPEVSGAPEGGTVASLDMLGAMTLAVGGCAEVPVSAAKIGADPMASVATKIVRRRVMSSSFSWLLEYGGLGADGQSLQRPT